MNESASRWKAAASTTQAPLKSTDDVSEDYAQKILEEQKEAFKKYGVNTKKVLGVKAFKPIGSGTSNEVDSIKPPKEAQPAPQTYSQPLVDIQPQINIGDRFGKAKIALPLIEVEEVEQPKHANNVPVAEVEVPSREQADEADYEQNFEEEEPSLPIQQVNQANSLLEGDYDQEKNRMEFEAAVLAYRGVYKKIEELAVQTDSKEESAPDLTTKLVCFGCYKPAQKSLAYEDRNFCSERCYKHYMNSITECCPNCDKKFIKFDGICMEGIRYCSTTCSPSAGEMQKLFIQWRLEEKKKQKQQGLFDDSLQLQ